LLKSFDWPVRVYYEDTDSGGVVYYANYLKFMERARTEWLRTAGFEQDALIRDRQIIFAVRTVQLDYLRPARFNDQLIVSVALVKAGRASLTLNQSVHKVDDDRPLCTGVVKIACLDSNSFKPRSIPQDIATCMVHE